MSTDGQGTKLRRKIVENFNRLKRVHERYWRQTDRQTDGTAVAYSERERKFTFAKIACSLNWNKNFVLHFVVRTEIVQDMHHVIHRRVSREVKTGPQRRIYGFWCPGQDFQSVPHMFFVMQIRVIFALPSPLWYPLSWCPGQLPQLPTPQSATAGPRLLFNALSVGVTSFPEWVQPSQPSAIFSCINHFSTNS